MGQSNAKMLNDFNPDETDFSDDTSDTCSDIRSRSSDDTSDTVDDLLSDYDIINEDEVEKIEALPPAVPLACEVEMYATEMDINLNWLNCKKNPKHIKFIPIPRFELNDLPYGIRTQEVYDWVRAMGNRTVKLTVKKTSEKRRLSDPYYNFIKSEMNRTCTGLCLCRGRWDRSYRHSWDREMTSSGESDSGSEMCNIPNCPFSEECGKHLVDAHLTFSIRTSRHCVYNDFEAAHTEVRFFYDTDDDEVENIIASGVQLLSVDPQADTVVLLCVAKHCEKLSQLCEQLTDFHIYTQEGSTASAPKRATSMKYAIMASHPHGTSKKISVGRFKRKSIRLLENTDSLKSEVKVIYSTPTCPGCSGAAVMIEQGHFPTSFLYVIHRGVDDKTSDSCSMSDVYSPCVF